MIKSQLADPDEDFVNKCQIFESCSREAKDSGLSNLAGLARFQGITA